MMRTSYYNIYFKKYSHFLKSERIPETMNSDPHLELIVGTMFSGKTTELIRRTNLYEVAGIKSQIFKPRIDDRYSFKEIKSHDQLGKEVVCVEDVAELKQRIEKNTDVIGIDEVQFFESSIVDFCDYLVNQGKIVTVAGLLKDFADNFFQFKDKCGGESIFNMSELLRISDQVTHLKALCTYDINGAENRKCAREASRVQRFVDGKIAPLNSPIVEIGGTKAYAARCRQHFQFYK